MLTYFRDWHTFLQKSSKIPSHVCPQ